MFAAALAPSVVAGPLTEHAEPLVAAPLVAAASRASAPSDCTRVTTGEALQRVVDVAQAGAALCLEPGQHLGPVHIEKPLTLWGPREAVIKSSGEGTTIDVAAGAGGTRLFGFTIDGSGARLYTLDSAVRVEGDDVVVEGLRVMHATFGVVAHRVRGVVVRRNHISGDATAALGMRGDGVRFWEVDDSVIADNVVENTRDIVVWYSRDNLISGNLVEGGRYGAHLMYSHENRIEHNRLVGNVVGVFLMYSRGVALRDNIIARSSGAAGVGLGVKESGDLVVERNAFVDDTVGAYLDTTPFRVDEHNRFARNLFRFCDTAVVFHSSAERNTFRENSFRDNRRQVRVEGRGDATRVSWLHNELDDYVGYDLDDDGYGDVPYELRSLTADLLAETPELSFFTGMPVLAFLEAAAELLPLLSPTLILRDPAPRMEGRPPEVLDAR